MRYSRKVLVIGALFFGMLLCGISWGQVVRSHEIGQLWETLTENGYSTKSPFVDLMSWPGGFYLTDQTSSLVRRGHWIGVRNWTNQNGIFHNHKVSEGGPHWTEASLFGVPPMKYVYNPPPTVIVDEKTEERLTGQYDRRKTDFKADEMIVATWNTDVGVSVTMTSYAFANQNHDDYVIFKYDLKNTGNTDLDAEVELPSQHLEGVYFGAFNYLRPCKRGADYTGTSGSTTADDWVHYYGSQPGDTLRGLWYCYDGNAPEETYPTDDTGDPHKSTGEFLSPQYAGFGVIQVDTSPSDKRDDLNQPSTVDFQPFETHLTHNNAGITERDLYDYLSSGKKSLGSDAVGLTNPSSKSIVAPVCMLGFGPYNLAFGQSVQIVLFVAVNGLSREKCIELGHKWKVDSLEFNGKVGDDAKNALLATGRDSLFQTAYRAAWAWAHNLDVPDPPASPSLTIKSGTGQVYLEWSDMSVPAKGRDRDTRQYDFAGYRLYRAKGSFMNPYELIWECGGNTGIPDTNVYVDTDVESSRRYYYYVTAYDDGSQNTSGLFPGQSLESSHFLNRNVIYAAEPTRPPSKTLEGVVVVPNPYDTHSFRWDNPDEIKFMGLPYKAKIRIYTLAGDLLKTIEHPSEPKYIGHSEPWNQVTDDNMLITSGTYVYHVEGWDENSHFLGSTKGIFVIVR